LLFKRYKSPDRNLPLLSAKKSVVKTGKAITAGNWTKTIQNSFYIQGYNKYGPLLYYKNEFWIKRKARWKRLLPPRASERPVHVFIAQ